MVQNKAPNKALHRMAITLRSIATSELKRYAVTKKLIKIPKDQT